MCGIAGIYIRNTEAAKDVFKTPEMLEYFVNGLLLGIEPRGRDATGVVSVEKGGTEAKLCKSDLDATKFIEWREALVPEPRIVLCHTRFSTKGSPMNLNNNHPVQYESVFVTHNGHISNDDELFEEHKIKRIAQVDTEIIPALIHLKGLGKTHEVLEELIGNYAIAAIQPKEHPDSVVLAKGPSSPFEYVDLGSMFIWASTRDAISKAWQLVFPGKQIKKQYWGDLKYATGLVIKDNRMQKFDFKVKPRPTRSWNNNGGSTGHVHSYPHSQYGEGYYSGPIYDGDARMRDICECGQERYWHDGHNNSGPCIKKYTMQDGHHSPIHCKGFKKKIISTPNVTVRDATAADLNRPALTRGSGSEDKPKAKGSDGFVVIDGPSGEEREYRVCLGCQSAYPIEEMSIICGHLVCEGCNTEAQDHETEEKEESRTDETSEIREVAEELGVKPDFVEWILFDAEDKDFDDDPWLIQIYCAIDDAYNKAMKRSEKAWRDQMKLDEEAFESCGVAVFEGEGTS